MGFASMGTLLDASKIYASLVHQGHFVLGELKQLAKDQMDHGKYAASGPSSCTQPDGQHSTQKPASAMH